MRFSLFNSKNYVLAVCEVFQFEYVGSKLCAKAESRGNGAFPFSGLQLEIEFSNSLNHFS